MKVDAFFEGGGILGLSFIGVYKALSERGIYIDKALGISSGSIMATLIKAGYSANELIEILCNNSYSFFKQKTITSERNYIGKPLSILFNKGIYDSYVIEEWMEEVLLRKKIVSFKDVLYQNESMLKIIATDFSNKKMLVLPDDLPNYGIDSNFYPISKAVRMSCAIPFFYTPFELLAKNKVNYIIDGGVIRNIPTTILNNEGYLKNLTLRFKIKDQSNKIFNTLSDIRNNYFNKKKNNPLERIIIINNDTNIKATDFDINHDQIIHLYKQGYKAALKFIKEEFY